MKNSSHSAPIDAEVYSIDEKYVKSALIASFLSSLLVIIGSIGVFWMIVAISTDEGTPVNRNTIQMIIILSDLGLVILINVLTYIFARIYVTNFSYAFSEKFIVIRYGIFTRTKTTIPYSRIQNVAVYQNIRDRILNIYTVKVETAGSSAAVSNNQKGLNRPEGYIPAVKDPTKLEEMIDKLVHRYTQDQPSAVKSQVFTDSNVAFDEFIAYFLSKMREKDQLSTNIQELRENHHLTQSQLAEKLHLSTTTIKYLEAGEFVPSLTLALEIAKELEVPVEKLFKLK